MSRYALMLNYSFSAVTKNWNAVLVFFLLILLLLVLHFVPLLSFVGQIAMSLLVTQLQVYYGRGFLSFSTKEELLNFIRNSSVREIFTEYIPVSSAIFLASFITTTVLMLFTVALLFFTGIFYKLKGISTVEGVLLYGFVCFVLLSLLWLSYLYVFPLGVGYSMSRDSFGEAFVGFFRIFTPGFWKRALEFEYFKLITLGGLLFTVFVVVAFVFFVTVILSPLGVAVLYLAAVFWGSLCAESYRVAFPQLQPDDKLCVDQ